MGGWVPGFSGVSLIRWDLSGLSGFGQNASKGLSGRSAAGENLRDLGSERLIFLYKIAFRRRSNPFFCACGGLYDSRSQNNIASITSSESKLDTFRMNSSWELKEIAYAANENRATGTVESKTVGLELHHAMVIAYVWAGLSALSPDRADLTTLSPIGSST